MEDTEKIPVFLKIINGKTVCVCHAGQKGCRDHCQRDTVTRDKFDGWKDTLYRNRFGR